MLLHNPTKNKLEVMIEGQEYSINANDSIEINDAVGKFWKSRLHNFLEISESNNAPIKENVQIKEVESEEVSKEDNNEEANEEVEEVVEETVVKSTPKNKNKNK